MGLTFDNENDYEKVLEDDTIDLMDLLDFSPDKSLTLKLNHADGSSETIKVNHSYNDGQIAWFKAGSSLNLIKEQEIG